MNRQMMLARKIPRNELPRIFFPQGGQGIDGNGNEYRLDFYRFSKYVLGYSKLGPEHKEWAKRLHEAINIRKQRKLVLLKPRGTYKSTFYTVSFPIWMHLLNPNLRILIANAIEGNATKFLGEITAHYLRNENLAEIYRLRGLTGSPINPNAALKKELRLTNCTKIQKEPNIATAGYGSSAVSQHYDIIIVDDLVDRNDRESETVREDKKRWFGDLASLLEPDGLMLMVGTRWHFSDTYDYIINDLNPKHSEQDKYHVEVESCYIGSGDTKIAAFPRILPLGKLEELKIDKGLAEFVANYVNSPLPEEAQIFRLSEMSFFDMKELYRRPLSYYGFCDPALGKTKSDYAPIITIGIDEDGIIYVVDALVERSAPNATQEAILQRALKYPYTIFGVESNGFQELFISELIQKSTKQRAYVKVEHVNHSTNKRARIEGLQSLTYSDALRPAIIRFRRDWETAYPLLIDQLLKFPNAAWDDAGDALEGAVMLARRIPEADAEGAYLGGGGTF